MTFTKHDLGFVLGSKISSKIVYASHLSQSDQQPKVAGVLLLLVCLVLFSFLFKSYYIANTDENELVRAIRKKRDTLSYVVLLPTLCDLKLDLCLTYLGFFKLLALPGNLSSGNFSALS